jgi:hypothetical protein
MIFAPFAFQNQAIVSTPGIVTTNLVLYYDAGNTSSYPGTGTTWSNLQATTLNQTLTNGPTYSTNNGGTIVFDGTNDYTTSATNSILNFGTGDFTIEIWTKIVGNSAVSNDGVRDATLFCAFPTGGSVASSYAFTMIGNSTTTGTGLVFAPRNAASTLQLRTLTYSFTQNQFYQVGITHKSGVTNFFVNGTTYTPSGGNLTLDIQTSTRPVNIGRLGYAGYLHYLNGTIGIVRIYKGTGLDSSQILQNYNANSNRI